MERIGCGGRIGALLVLLGTAASLAVADPVQWSGSRGGATVTLYVDGQRATGGVRADIGDGSVDLTLVGTGVGTRYSGTLSGTRRPRGANRDQDVAGSWDADLKGAGSPVTVRITKVDGRPQTSTFALPLATSAAPPPLRCGWTKGDVTAQRGDAAVRPVRTGDPVRIGDTVRTGARSSAIVILGNRSVVMMQELTTLALPASDDNRGGIHKVKAQGGRIWFAVRKVGPNQKFEVETDEAVASVRGTEFLVESDANGELSVTTADGEVDVSDPRDPALAPVPVMPGMRWLAGRRAPNGPRRWAPPRPVDLAPIVERWQPMLNLADHVWVHRRLGKRNFWQDRLARPGPRAPLGRGGGGPGGPRGRGGPAGRGPAGRGRQNPNPPGGGESRGPQTGRYASVSGPARG